MALRVLLADESSTIKKAIQMALSDLGVEVKSVPSGLDVLSVSRTFKPDLILADVLLTKKNGYEVCSEIKSDSELNQTPVILMWSSFMQLDQSQYTKAQANGALEKPFDSETLRNLVEKLVPKTSQFPLKGLLNHPELPDFEESETFVRQKSDFVKNQKIQNPTYDIDEVDEFSEVPLKSRTNEKVDDWTASSADQFSVETESYGDFEEVTVTTRQKSSGAPDLQRKIQEQLDNYLKDSPIAQNQSKTTMPRQINGLDEQIMKEEIRMMAEKICWQILPEITEKIVREELNKLLHGLEKI